MIVYFSLDGNTDYAATRIAEKTDAELLRLKPEKEYPKAGAMKMFVGGRAAMRGEKPALRPYGFSPAEYDLIVIGSPVWAGRCAPPVNTFLGENDLAGRTVAYFCCHAGGGPKKFNETMRTALKGCSIAAEADFRDPYTKRCDGTDARIDEFCSRLEAGAKGH